MSDLPNLSLALLERIFPRTSLCLTEPERKQIARQFTKLGDPKEWKRIPNYLAARKWDRRAFLPDLANLEVLLRQTILAPELERRGFDQVATASEPDWFKARFRFDPASKILESDWPLDEIHARPQASHRTQASSFLIYRESGKPAFRRLRENESLLIQSLSLGVPLGQVLERKTAPDFDAMTFHHWIDSGLLRAIDWAPV